MPENKILECVPNFSVGKNTVVIERIAQAIESVQGVKLLHVDSGKAANRTVYTFAGSPQQVIEAAFQGIKKATELIDMRTHRGQHPRLGATDVCPLIPVTGIDMDEAIEWANKLAERVGKELALPVFLYEESASADHRKNLAAIREGQFEGLEEKMKQQEWKPDFGPDIPHPSAGATVIGARNFLIAYNINLNTTSVRIANEIAGHLRESGRIQRTEIPGEGEVAYDALGEMIRVPGSLEAVKAIGWFIEEYKTTQISMNITNIKKAPIHIVFEEAEKEAMQRGVRVTGSEIVGLVPLQVLIDAGRYFLEKQNRSAGVSEEEVLVVAAKTLGLSEFHHFDPNQRILEYRLKDENENPLVKLNLREYANELASEAPAPGGGSASAYTGALAAALTAMVANVSANKKGWSHRIGFFSNIAIKAHKIKDTLLALTDEDAEAFRSVMHTRKFYRKITHRDNSAAEKIEEANKHAARVPLQVLENIVPLLELLRLVITEGIDAAKPDGKVAMDLAKAAAEGAFTNVEVNLDSISDKEFVSETRKRAVELIDECRKT